MTDDLVKRLWESDEASALTNQAARRIEELKAKLDLSEGALDVASKSWGECQRILKQTEAKLAKAVGGLIALRRTHAAINAKKLLLSPALSSQN